MTSRKVTNKKPPSYLKNKKNQPRKRTARDWAIIAFSVFLAITIVIPLVASLFGQGGGAHF